jgi:shikimate kinase
MPASGKSTLGRKLSTALGFNFIDLDVEIEKREWNTVSKIFAEKGEDYFRRAERDILKTLLIPQTIISTGGGTPCFFDNMDFIKKNGLSIYLKVPVEALAKRVNLQNNTRPLLNNLQGKQLQEELAAKLALRSKFYERADLTITDKDTNDIAKIITLIKQKEE